MMSMMMMMMMMVMVLCCEDADADYDNCNVDVGGDDYDDEHHGDAGCVCVVWNMHLLIS